MVRMRKCQSHCYRHLTKAIPVSAIGIATQPNLAGAPPLITLRRPDTLGSHVAPASADTLSCNRGRTEGPPSALRTNRSRPDRRVGGSWFASGDDFLTRFGTERDAQ